MIKDQIKIYLQKYVKDGQIEISVPENEKFGHYSTNTAMRLAKTRRENPMKIAKDIADFLMKNSNGYFSKIDVASPGFVNFWISEKILQKELAKIIAEKSKYGKPNKKTLRQAQGLKKIQIEFISANPTGLLTIGNGRGGFLGDTLGNLLKFYGHKVEKEYYVNDAKASAQIKELGKTVVGEGTSYLTEYLEEKISAKKSALRSLKKKIKNKEKLYAEAGALIAKEIQNENKKFIKKKLKIKFNNWFSEENLYKKKLVDKLLKTLKDKNLVYKKEGAIWFKTSEFGDPEDRVLIRQTGEPTYFLPDLVYHLDKFKNRKFDDVVDIWGADHHGYGPRLRAGLQALDVKKDRLHIMIVQLVRLVKGGEEFKMSKRKGVFVALEDLIDEVGIDVARFFFLMSNPETHMDFDMDLAKEKSLKNPVYYIQYAAVRCAGIFKKIGKLPKPDYSFLSAESDIALIKILARYPEIIEEAAKNYNPQILIRYSMNLAKKFHNFYENERILGEKKEIASARLTLVKASLVIFKSVFSILGIDIPKKM
ncbi:MAG: arginine--tRNA ligase [Patescibacteria group bacterium]|nr:arginine--tRNA ligase [Patescibacteria group bacterium]